MTILVSVGQESLKSWEKDENSSQVQLFFRTKDSRCACWSSLWTESSSLHDVHKQNCYPITEEGDTNSDCQTGGLHGGEAEPQP